jgi:hypothetical protein
MSAAQLVGFTSLNLKALIPLMQAAVGRNIADVADGANIDPPLHHMLCMAAIKDDKVRPSADSVRTQTHLFHAIVLVGCDERDTAEVLSIASMPSVVTPTKARGIDCVLLAGTVEQWIGAVTRGCSRSVSREVREVYNGVYQQFSAKRLGTLFPTPVQSTDNTFYLEKK